jgi:hypothetical protein
MILANLLFGQSVEESLIIVLRSYQVFVVHQHVLESLGIALDLLDHVLEVRGVPSLIGMTHVEDM